MRIDPARLLTPLTVIILAIVLLQCLVGASPDIYWDVDPRSANALEGIVVISPMVTAWLNVLSVTIAAVVLLVHVRLGGRINRPSVILALFGAAACAWHARDSMEDFQAGPMWIAGFAIALAGFHLAQHDRPRRLIVASLIAMLAPMALGAIVYIYHDHPMTVEHFYDNEKEILSSRGWAAGSAQHELYKRRLESPDATGAFGLSNVFGSVVGALTLMTIAAGVGLIRRRQWKFALLPILLTAGGIFTILLTHSKGAAAAWLGCLGLLGVSLILPKLARPAAMAMVILAIAAVLVRGAMGPPESHEGERSILFRYHYWQASVRALMEEPVRNVALGLGVKGFSRAYLRHKNPINPEDVSSAHNVFVDWITMLGIGGGAWSLVLLYWLWRSGMPRGDLPDPEDAAFEIDNGDVRIALILALLVFGAEASFKRVVLLTTPSFMAFSFGAIFFVAIVSALQNRAWIDGRSASLGLFLAAAMLLVHNQIEMTFANTGPAVVALFVMGVAAGGRGAFGKPATGRRAYLVPAGTAAVAIVLLVGHAIPTTRYQRWLGRAAHELKDREVRQSIESLDRAWRILPFELDPLQWQTRIYVDGMLEMSRRNQPAQGLKLADTALSIADRAGDPDNLTILRLKSQINERAGEWFSDARRIAVAAELLERAMPQSPYNLDQHMDLADLYWRLGRRQDARQVYQRCLELSDQAYLDPAKQLTDRQRALIAERSDVSADG